MTLPLAPIPSLLVALPCVAAVHVMRTHLSPGSARCRAGTGASALAGLLWRVTLAPLHLLSAAGAWAAVVALAPGTCQLAVGV